MSKIGLKLWSINTDYYYEEAKRLYRDGWFDYIELYVAPDTLDSLEKWKTLNIPINIHCAHFAHEFNLAKEEYKEKNSYIYLQAKRFADELNSQYIVFHGGLEGHIEQTAKQLKFFNDSRALIENKPYKAFPNKMGGKVCRGASIEEIKYILDEVKCGFCFDIGHALCAADSFKINRYEYVKSFNELNPVCYHLSDNYIGNELDRHLHLGCGNYDFKTILNIVDKNKYIALETNKDSKENLNDFKKDVECLKNYL
ncbi:MAG: sugar phosphate isomerase/epimerase [Elusimicrobiota bacterium]|jgi:sugar phosphate isomerase/epimerase|nr:sugar phosphate isomerase/epimerase [Elusimicrobiota bacterium]